MVLKQRGMLSMKNTAFSSVLYKYCSIFRISGKKAFGLTFRVEEKKYFSSNRTSYKKDTRNWLVENRQNKLCPNQF
jgi:hypothetical protein